jgi:cupin 2 domain-containing protein
MQVDNQKKSPGVECGNLFAGQPDTVLQEEIFDVLLSDAGTKIERIISTGQRTSDGDWYDQAKDEWVVLLSGAARLRLEDEAEERTLLPGDWVLLPAHCRHLVTWTQAQPPTVWLAVHTGGENSEDAE